MAIPPPWLRYSLHQLERVRPKARVRGSCSPSSASQVSIAASIQSSMSPTQDYWRLSRSPARPLRTKKRDKKREEQSNATFGSRTIGRDLISATTLDGISSSLPYLNEHRQVSCTVHLSLNESLSPELGILLKFQFLAEVLGFCRGNPASPTHQPK